MMYKKERPGYLLGGLLRPGIKYVFKKYIKNAPMYKEVVKAVKEGSASKADKVMTGITGLRAHLNAMYKQNRAWIKNELKKPVAKRDKAMLFQRMGRVQKELAKDISLLKKSKAKHMAKEVSEKMNKLGIKKHFKGGLIRKPKLAKRGF